jgi:hypothetical protein
MSSSSPAKAIADLVEGVTEKWAKQRKAEERDSSARRRRDDRLVYYMRPISLKDAARDVMRQAYMQASAGGTLTCNSRQIMYAARPEILKIAEKDHLDSQYFCQTLLPDYIREHPFVEPHTGRASESARSTFGIMSMATHARFCRGWFCWRQDQNERPRGALLRRARYREGRFYADFRAGEGGR